MTYQTTIAALADPTRRAILERLRASPCNVAGWAGALPVSRPAVSQHLKVLSNAGLLTCKQHGTRRVYRLAPEGAEDLRTYLDGLWGDVMNAFANHIDKETNND